uniref:Uncharacterized protein n=1 Tax=Arundo donax TaxID=35708 RepID=A0A0A8YWG6_ARUDO
MSCCTMLPIVEPSSPEFARRRHRRPFLWSSRT